MRTLKVLIFVLMMIGCLMATTACGEEERIIVNIPTTTPEAVNSGYGEIEPLPTEIPIDNNDRIKLSNTLASEYIRFVNSDCEYFWEKINNNPIDKWYSDNYIDNDSTRLILEKNKVYYDMWQAEALVTYNELAYMLDDEHREYLSLQYDEFFSWLSHTNKIYDILITENNGYNNKITRNLKIYTSYASVNKVREYTIGLKEMVYLLSSNVSFAIFDKSVSDREELDISISTIESFDNIGFNLIDDDIVKDILTDNYSDEINSYNNFNGYNSSKRNKSQQYLELWKNNVTLAYSECYLIFNEDEQKILVNQYETWDNYVNNTVLIANYVFENSDMYDTVMYNDEEADLNILKGNCYADFYFEVLEYIYIFGGKIDI